jgi:hypothetical protein
VHLSSENVLAGKKKFNNCVQTPLFGVFQTQSNFCELVSKKQIRIIAVGKGIAK